MQLLTWNLWQQIQVADRQNPLYHRAFHTEANDQGIVARAALEIITVLSASPIAFIIFPAVPLLLMLAHTLNGVSLATTASTHLVQEKESSTFDLVTAIPSGAMFAIWAITRGALHRTHAYRSFCMWQKWIPRAIPIAFIIYSVMTFLTAIDDKGGLLMTVVNGAFFLVLVPTLIVIMLSADNIQSIVIATLTGSLIALYIESRDHARLLAVLGFLFLQILVYLVIIYLTYLPVLHLLSMPTRITLSQWYITLAGLTLYTPFLLAAFVGMRELMARRLWRALQEQIYAR